MWLSPADTVGAVVRHLPRVIPAAPGGPEPGANVDHPMRKVTRQIAFEPGGWTAERRAKVADLFDSLAPEWHTRASSERTEPVMDALDRGGPFPAGPCLEVGSGIGLLTPVLAVRFPTVIALDLSLQMLRLAPSGAEDAPRVLGDGGFLPLPSSSMAAVVLVNAFLFPDEVRRVLQPGGAVVWVNTAGSSTPIHLSAEEIDDAFGGTWDGVASEAGWGTWAAFRTPA